MTNHKTDRERLVEQEQEIKRLEEKLISAKRLYELTLSNELRWMNNHTVVQEQLTAAQNEVARLKQASDAAKRDVEIVKKLSGMDFAFGIGSPHGVTNNWWCTMEDPTLDLCANSFVELVAIMPDKAIDAAYKPTNETLSPKESDGP